MITSTLMNATMLLSLWVGVPAAPPPGPAATPPVAAPQPRAARPAQWKMVASSGRVETRVPLAPETAWRPARRGDRVAPLSHLRTLERARATLTRGGDLILVDAGSEIVVPETAPGQGTLVMQRSGNAIYKVAPRRPGERFEVRTPYLVAGVKGTRFSVQIRDGSAAVSVLEGVVEVISTNTGESRDLAAGEWTIVDALGGRLETHELAPGMVEETPRPGGELLRDPVDDVLETSVRLDVTLEKDTALLADASLDLWSDLSDDTTLTRTVDRTLDKTLTRLDPAAQDTQSDPTLLDLLPLRKKP